MKLIASWKDSLQLLRPATLHQFLLVTLKAVLDFYKGLNALFVNKSNWILVAVTIVLIGLAHVIAVWHLFFFGAFLINSIRWLFIFFLCLALRDSVAVKDRDYFVSYAVRYSYLLIGAFLIAFLSIEAIPFVLLWYILCMLFLLDAPCSLSAVFMSLKRSFLMVLYNLPACAALYLVLSLLGLVLYRMEAWALGYTVGFVFIICLYGLFLPLEVALITNFYLKRIHEQPDLYFNQPKQ